jgi:hypothetical protein
MANKVQAKAAIDSAATQIKADIDNILPAGVNIMDGLISFGPIRWELILDAGGSRATAETWLSSIVVNLTAAARPSTIRRLRRGDDGSKEFSIFTTLATYTITNI